MERAWAYSKHSLLNTDIRENRYNKRKTMHPFLTVVEECQGPEQAVLNRKDFYSIFYRTTATKSQLYLLSYYSC